MKRKELNKTFMIDKNPLVSMVYIKYFSVVRVKDGKHGRRVMFLGLRCQKHVRYRIFYFINNYVQLYYKFQVT